VPTTEFYLLPGITPQKENALKPGELIVAVTIPATAHGKRSTYLKVRERASYAYALA